MISPLMCEPSWSWSVMIMIEPQHVQCRFNKKQHMQHTMLNSTPGLLAFERWKDDFDQPLRVQSIAKALCILILLDLSNNSKLLAFSSSSSRPTVSSQAAMNVFLFCCFGSKITFYAQFGSPWWHPRPWSSALGRSLCSPTSAWPWAPARCAACRARERPRTGRGPGPKGPPRPGPQKNALGTKSWRKNWQMSCLDVPVIIFGLPVFFMFFFETSRVYATFFPHLGWISFSQDQGAVVALAWLRNFWTVPLT